MSKSAMTTRKSRGRKWERWGLMNPKTGLLWVAMEGVSEEIVRDCATKAQVVVHVTITEVRPRRRITKTRRKK